jgi:hypothetical protein
MMLKARKIRFTLRFRPPAKKALTCRNQCANTRETVKGIQKHSSIRSAESQSALSGTVDSNLDFLCEFLAGLALLRELLLAKDAGSRKDAKSQRNAKMN